MSKWMPVAAAVALWLSGCGGGPNLTEVEGVVKLKGQPIGRIAVEFWPESNGPRSVGMTDDQGKFTLTTDDDKQHKGAVPGKHRVVLRDHEVLGGKLLGRAAEGVDMSEGRKSRISEVYLDVAKSPLTAQVTTDKKLIELDAEPYSAR
jgi:hypothetical protein